MWFSFPSLILVDDLKKGIRINAFGSLFSSNVRMANFQVRGDGSKRMKSEGIRFIENPNFMITVYGYNGNGKTTWAQAIVNECIEDGLVAVYITASDAIAYLKKGIGNDDHDVDARLNSLTDVPALVLDELTQPRWTEWVEDQLTTLIDRRYRLDE